MTRMLPAETAQGTNRSERTVFEAIRDAEDSTDWYCLHSVGIARHKRKSYAECDFVLITEFGVFCLEVKGGEVSRRDGSWKIGWAEKSYTSKEGPFKQSQSAMQALIAELKLQKGQVFKRRVIFGWGVIFPDIEFHESDPEWDLEVVYDRRDRSRSFRDFIVRLARHTRQQEMALGRRFPDRIDLDARKIVVSCFRHDFALVPLLPDLLRDSKDELVRLSNDQFAILKYALDPGNPRCLCPGGAGTGKTIIATEIARRLSGDKRKTLFLCFYRLLAQHLMTVPDIDPAFVTVSSLHRFMTAKIISAGLGHELAELQRSYSDEDAIFMKHIPQLFEVALLEKTIDPGDQYDALIVDEAQDILHSPIVDALDLVVTGGWDNGCWIVFFDPDLQSDVFGRFDDKVLINLAAQRTTILRLDENFRNPEPIVSELARLVRLVKPPKCRRRLLVRMEYSSYADPSEEGTALGKLLENVIAAGVKPNDICVLSPRQKEKSCIWRNRSSLPLTVTHFEKSLPASVAPGSILAATISGFKGLEAEVVILTDMPESLGDGELWNKAMWYVGMTRCKTKLFAIVSREFSSQHLFG